MIIKKLLEIHIIYASQKGTSKSIAEDVSEECHSKNIICKLNCISSLSVQDLYKEDLFIFIAATTGDGEPPDTAREFIREAKNLPPKCKNFQYTVLGLGDTNYTNFCNFGKTLDKTLNDIGGVRFYSSAWADDGTGLEEVVDPWIDELYPVLVKKNMEFANAGNDLKIDIKNMQEPVKQMESLMLSVSNLSYQDIVEILSPKSVLTSQCLLDHSLKKLEFQSNSKLTLPVYNGSYLDIQLLTEGGIKFRHKGPFPFSDSELLSCSVAKHRYLSGPNAYKSTLELTLSLPTDISFEPGDSFSILPQNDKQEVDLLLKILGLREKAHLYCNTVISENSTKKSGKVPVYLQNKFTLVDIFTHVLDIRTIPKKAFLRALVEYTDDPEEKRRLAELASKEGTSSYTNNFRLNGVCLLDLLLIFKSCKPPLSVLFEHIPKLQPRPYSVASSPLSSPNHITFSFNIIDIKKDNYKVFDRTGVCTGYLQKVNTTNSTEMMNNLNVDSTVKIYLRANKSFRLPENLSIPVIMVGPGTGVAPFIGFLNHRYHMEKTIGDCYLFFGCRSRDDYIYKEELENFEKSNVLTRLFTCYSRELDSIEKYVQDNIMKHCDFIGHLICNRGATVYVCGDAKNMSKDVMNCFVEVVRKYLNTDETNARNYVTQLQLNNKYLQDVWN